MKLRALATRIGTVALAVLITAGNLALTTQAADA